MVPKIILCPGVVVYTCKFSTGEVEAGGLQIYSQPGLHSKTLHLKKTREKLIHQPTDRPTDPNDGPTDPLFEFSILILHRRKQSLGDRKSFPQE